MHKNRKTSESFAISIRDKFNLELITEYTGAKNKCTVKGVCGHTWGIIPSNLISRGSRKECRECLGLVKEYTKWDTNKLGELQLGINNNLSIEELARVLNSSVHAVNKAVEVYGLSRVDYRLGVSTIPKIVSMIETLGYTLLTPLKDIINSREYITYICNNGHEYTQLIGNFLKEHRCGVCAKLLNVSKGEKELLEFIRTVVPQNTWIVDNDRTILDGLELDIVLPDLGIAFEYNGNYNHSEERGKSSNYHINKLEQVEEFDYRLISITDEEWLTKNDLVKSRIKSILGINKSIYARKCILKEICYSQCSDFCEVNHIQGGKVKTSINLGLFNEDLLVAIMSFSKARFSSAYEYELVRYCSLIGYSVVGGASKLLKYFERTYLPESIGSYSDRRWNTGGLYTKLGFSFIHNSAPDYVYIKNGKSFNRQRFQKHKLKELFPEIYSEEKTEVEIMREAKYLRVFGCGSALFIKKY